MGHQITDAQAVQAMRALGGHFIKALALAWLAADPLNQARIKQAFEAEFDRYRELADTVGEA